MEVTFGSKVSIYWDEMQHTHKAYAYIPVPKGTDVHSLTKKCQLWRDADGFGMVCASSITAIIHNVAELEYK